MQKSQHVTVRLQTLRPIESLATEPESIYLELYVYIKRKFSFLLTQNAITIIHSHMLYTILDISQFLIVYISIQHLHFFCARVHICVKMYMSVCVTLLMYWQAYACEIQTTTSCIPNVIHFFFFLRLGLTMEMLPNMVVSLVGEPQTSSVQLFQVCPSTLAFYISIIGSHLDPGVCKEKTTS